MQKFVASIFFEACRVERPIYGGDFKLPAVPRSSPPFLLLVHDHTQWEKQPYSAGGRSAPRLIMGEHIADDIVLHLATMGLGMNTDCGPGIWIVRDSVPDLDPNGAMISSNGKPVMRHATDYEKQEMFDDDATQAILRQQRYGEYLISRGDAYAMNPKERILITSRMKTACRYYNREREWLAELKDGDLKLCPFCFKSIDARTVVCASCSNVVDPVKHAAMLASQKRIEKDALTT